MTSEDLASEERSIREAIRLRPGDPDSHHNLGTALGMQERWKEAEEAFRRAIALRPRHADSHYGLGIALRMQERWKEAEEAIRRAIALRPDHAGSHYALGLTILMRKQWRGTHLVVRWNEAGDAFRKAIELKPDDPDALFSFGFVLMQQERWTEAEDAFRKAIALRPDHADSYYNLRTSLRKQRRWEEAEEAHREALRLRPPWWRRLPGLGQITLLYEEFLARERRRQLSWISAIRSQESADQSRVEDYVRNCVTRTGPYYAVEAMRARLLYRLGSLLALAFLGSLIVVPLMVSSQSLGRRLLIIPLIVFVTAVGILLLFGLARVPDSRVQIAGLAVLLGAYFLIARAAPSFGVPSFLEESFRLGSWLFLLFWGASLFLTLPFELARVLIEWHRNRRFPDFVIVLSFLELISDVSDGDPRMQEWRRQVVADLEAVARRIERGLPSFILRQADPNMKGWLRARARERARAVRRWKYRVLLDPHSSTELLEAATRGLSLAVDGDWVQFEREAEPRERELPATSQLLRAIRQLISAVLPLLVLLGLRADIFPLDLEEDVVISLMPFAVGWLAVHALTWIDPQATQMLSSATNVVVSATRGKG